MTGAVVVVDVIRAFTTAAAWLAAGASRVLCVESVACAYRVKAVRPSVLLVGEEWGLRPAAFDFGNSPREVPRACPDGRDVVLLSQNGTPALVTTGNASTMLAAAAVNVTATARWISRHLPGESVTIVCTGATGEDRACAEHLATLLIGGTPDPNWTAARIDAGAKEHLCQWRSFHSAAACCEFQLDAAQCGDLDTYAFAMLGVPVTDAVALELVA